MSEMASEQWCLLAASCCPTRRGRAPSERAGAAGAKCREGDCGEQSCSAGRDRLRPSFPLSVFHLRGTWHPLASHSPQFPAGAMGKRRDPRPAAGEAEAAPLVCP